MNQIIHFYVMCLMEFVLVLSCEHNSCTTKEIDKDNARKERALLFPPSSTIGILAAISLPLDDRKNVFFSYNFEANYNSPYLGSDYIPGPLTQWGFVRSFGGDSTSAKPVDGEDSKSPNESAESRAENEMVLETTTSTELAIASKTKRSLVTRTNLYKTIEKKLNAAGFNGHDCLLRAICQASEIPLGLHNGVLGDIMHVIFTPSSSAKENILYDFYDAEIHGTMNMCKHYKTLQ